MSLDVKERINCFQLVLYKDSDTLDYSKIIERIKSNEFYSCKYYSCCHNKDTDKNGEIKKEHYHVVIKLDNAISIENILKSLSNEQNIQSAIANNLSIIKSFKGSIRYLIHYDNKDKYQYELKDIITNDRNISYYFNDNTIVDNFQLITSIIKENNIKSMRELVYYCVENNKLLAMQYIQDNAYLVSCLFRY